MEIRLLNRKNLEKEILKLSQNFEFEMLKGMQEAGLFLESEIKKDWPTSSGVSGREITADTTISNGLAKTWVGSSLKAPWAIVVEKGRAPGKLPNLGAISKWIARTPKVQTGLREMVRRNGGRLNSIQVQDKYETLDSTQRGVVFVIARSIAKKGIKGRFIFKKVRQKKIRQARKIVLKRLQILFS